MDLSIFPAVAVLMFVLLSLPGGDKQQVHAQRIKNYSVNQAAEGLDVSYPRKNRFRQRYKDKPASAADANITNIATAVPSKKGRMMGEPASAVVESPIVKSTTSFSKNKKKPRRMEVDLDQKEDDKNYQSIYRYIRKNYRRVSKEDADQIAKSLVEYGRKNNLDPKFAAALMARESAFNRQAVSSSGARGLGQIKGMNYKSLGISDPHDISQGTKGTVQYLRRMLNIWKGKSEDVSLALASYYKGHGAVKRDKEKLDTPTQGYVADILRNYEKLKSMKENMR